MPIGAAPGKFIGAGGADRQGADRQGADRQGADRQGRGTGRLEPRRGGHHTCPMPPIPTLSRIVVVLLVVAALVQILVLVLR